MIDAALFSRASDNWATPPDLLEYLGKKYGGPFFDPCPLNFWDIICWEFIGPFVLEEEISGLRISWANVGPVFVNPPYSDLAEWAEKAAHEAINGAELILFLCPSRTDTKYFHRYLMRASEIYFIEGRLHFNGSKNSAPFPSMIAIFGPSPLRHSGVLLTSPIARALTRREMCLENLEKGEIYRSW